MCFWKRSWKQGKYRTILYLVPLLVPPIFISETLWAVCCNHFIVFNSFWWIFHWKSSICLWIHLYFWYLQRVPQLNYALFEKVLPFVYFKPPNDNLIWFFLVLTCWKIMNNQSLVQHLHAILNFTDLNHIFLLPIFLFQPEELQFI